MKNKVSAKKLSLYFALVLIIFSIITGFIFFSLFKKQTVTIQENNLIERAETIAKDISKQESSRGLGGFGSYLKSINAIAGADAWIVDKNSNIVTAHWETHGNHSGMGKMKNRVVENNETLELPKNAEDIIKQVLSGKITVSKVFSDLIGEATITVGVPINTTEGKSEQVVLLHSPVRGIDDAVKQGLKALGISLFIGLLITLALSVYLSRIFTGPILLKEAENIIKYENDRKNFIAKIAHELKTPITVMKSYLENFAIKDNPTVEELQEYNGQVLGEVNSLQRIVGDILDLTKLESPDFSMEVGELSLRDLLNDVSRSSRGLTKNKNIEILQENIPNITIIGDYGRLRQMFLIIIDNAIKFSKDNSKIEIYGQGTKIFIEDYGIGISEKEISKIFEKFYKSNSQANREGTGLGLSIAREIAMKHKIELSVTSQYGKGTCFIFDYKNIK